MHILLMPLLDNHNVFTRHHVQERYKRMGFNTIQYNASNIAYPKKGQEINTF